MARPVRRLIIPLVIALTLVLTSGVWLSAIGNFLVDGQAPSRAEAVVVLAGDGFGYRILKGAELVKQGFAPVVFMSGPAGHYGIGEDELAIPFAVKHGYPREWFIGVPNESRSTRAEADALLSELRKRRIHSFLLVTSDYHTRRSRRIYREKARDISFRVIGAPDRYFRAGSWWKDREGRKIVFMESTKLITDLFGM